MWALKLSVESTLWFALGGTSIGTMLFFYILTLVFRLVGIARGEQEYFDIHGIPTATEACKSNALMRCCKDLGVASELW